MALAILRVKEGLDCSHLLGSLSSEKLDNGLNSHGGSERLVSYENRGFEKEESDGRPAASNGSNECPGTPQSLSKLNLSNETKNSNKTDAGGPKFGRRRNKSADDLTENGIYQ